MDFIINFTVKDHCDRKTSPQTKAEPQFSFKKESSSKPQAKIQSNLLYMYTDLYICTKLTGVCLNFHQVWNNHVNMLKDINWIVTPEPSIRLFQDILPHKEIHVLQMNRSPCCSPLHENRYNIAALKIILRNRACTYSFSTIPSPTATKLGRPNTKGGETPPKEECHQNLVRTKPEEVVQGVHAVTHWH